MRVKLHLLWQWGIGVGVGNSRDYAISMLVKFLRSTQAHAGEKWLLLFTNNYVDVVVVCHKRVQIAPLYGSASKVSVEIGWVMCSCQANGDAFSRAESWPNVCDSVAARKHSQSPDRCHFPAIRFSWPASRGEEWLKLALAFTRLWGGNWQMSKLSECGREKKSEQEMLPVV